MLVKQHLYTELGPWCGCSNPQLTMNTNMVGKKSDHYILSLTHWGKDKMAAISQITLSNAFSQMKMLGFWLKFLLKFVPKVPISNIPALVQIMAWRQSGNKPLSEPMIVRLPMHICVTRPKWVNFFCPPLSLQSRCCYAEFVSVNHSLVKLSK